VRLTADWFGHAISDKSVLVARRDGKVVGYVLGTSLAAKSEHAGYPVYVAHFPRTVRLLPLWSGVRG
jgi:hypothetical protein